MTRKPYKVTYEVGNTRSTKTLMLYGPNESEAIAELYRSCSVNRNETIIILSID